MTRHNVSKLEEGLVGLIERNIEERKKELAHLKRLRDGLRETSGSPYAELERRATSWLLIIRQHVANPRYLEKDLIPVTEAWIEHELALHSSPEPRCLLQLNLRSEQDYLHMQVATVNGRTAKWYTCGLASALEIIIDGTRTLFVYDLTTERVVERSGIKKTYDDQVETPYHFNDVHQHLRRYGKPILTEPTPFL